MMTNGYDYIIIGAGHNGLVAAAYLAKAKKKVLLLERRSIVGGSVVTESFGEGFNVDSIWTGGTLRPDVIKDLNLALPKANERPAFISLISHATSVTYGEHLVFDADSAKAVESIKRFSEKDAGRWPEFVREHPRYRICNYHAAFAEEFQL